MDTRALHTRIEQVQQKVDKHKKPLAAVVILGIILAALTFFVLVFMILRLIFGFGIGVYIASSGALKSQMANSNSAISNKVATTTKTTSGGYVRFKKSHTYPVYARPIGSDRRNVATSTANPYTNISR